MIGGVGKTGTPHPQATRSEESVRSADEKDFGGTVGRQGPAERGEAHPHEAPIDFDRLYAEMEFFDDVRGGGPDRDKVISARRLEMEYFKKMGVYSKVPKEEARRLGAKVITTKWVDTNNCSDAQLNYRSRLVGRELNLSDRPDLFAATPAGKSQVHSQPMCCVSTPAPAP